MMYILLMAIIRYIYMEVFMCGKVRININMSSDLVDFFQEYADKLGISRSAAMVVALNNFKDQQELLKMSRFLEDKK